MITQLYNINLKKEGGEAKKVGGEGFEPTKPKQQIYSLSHLTTLETSHHYVSMSQQRDSNPRPADYKSAALPTELCWQVGKLSTSHRST